MKRLTSCLLTLALLSNACANSFPVALPSRAASRPEEISSSAYLRQALMLRPANIPSPASFLPGAGWVWRAAGILAASQWNIPGHKGVARTVLQTAAVLPIFRPPSLRRLGEMMGRAAARAQRGLTGKNAARNWALISVALTPLALLVLALQPVPRVMRRQRWPTNAFLILYYLVLDRCVTLEGSEHLDADKPTILVGNHGSKTAMEALLFGAKLLKQRGQMPKFVSVSVHPNPRVSHYIELMGEPDGPLLRIVIGETTDDMIHFLADPAAFRRGQAVLVIFSKGQSDRDFADQMRGPWHTGAARAAMATGNASINPFYEEGLPFDWDDRQMLREVVRALPRRAFHLTIRIGPALSALPEESPEQYTERVRQAVLNLAADVQSRGEPARSRLPRSHFFSRPVAEEAA